MTFDGVHVAIATPFGVDFQVGLERLRSYAEWLIRAGVDGLVPPGTCGEYAQLSESERQQVVECVADVARGRVPIMVGVAAPTTAQVVRWTEHAKSVGAGAVMALPPVGYRATWEEVLTYYRAIGSVGMPIVVYNNPRDTGTDITAERLHALEQEAPISAVKEVSQDVRRLSEIREVSNVVLIAGADDLVLESVHAGASGWIAGMSNIVPAASMDLWRLATEEQWTHAWGLYRFMLPLLRFDTTPRLVQAIKYGMRAIGRPLGDTRPPRLPLSPKECNVIDGVLSAVTANSTQHS